MSNREPATIIIPAFNEAPRIAPVIEAVQSADSELVAADKIIVVDNNSMDNTAQVAHSLGALVTHCHEQGKAPAIAAGVQLAKHLGAKTITYLDADLVGLKGQHVNMLTRPVLEGRAGMTIGYLGGRTDFTKKWIYRHWAMFSGQRSLSLEVWNHLSARDLRAFRIESALNSLFRNSGRGAEIERIELEGVTHTGKFTKYPRLQAYRQYARIELSAIYGLTSRSSL